MKMKTMIAAGACALALGTQAEIRAVTPTVWEGGNTNSWQMKRHVAKLAEIKARGGAPLVFLGDSITHFWEMDRTWTNLLNVAGYDALNLGYGADRTEHVLWRITEGGELDGYKAKAVVLLIGTNNTGHNALDKESPLDTVRGVMKVIATIREKQPGALIVVQAIFPRGATADDPCRRRNDVVNTQMKGLLVQEKNVVWSDLAPVFTDAEGNLPRRLFPDLLHPVTPAYRIWFACIRPYLDAALAGRPVSTAVMKEGDYVPLFDGKTLNGWKVLGGDAKYTVEDGCIRGEGVPSTLGINTFLATEKTYGDFDLKVDFNCESGNSGIQFRSETREKYDPAWDWNPFKEGLHKVFGYQAEITPGGGCTGRIYDEERRGYRDGIVWLDQTTPRDRIVAAEKSFKKGDWNTMRIRCEGPRIRTWLNGNLVADIVDDMTPKGLIGLQVHQQGPKKEGVEFKPMVVRFRNVMIKELPPPESTVRAGKPLYDIGIARYTMWNTPFTNALEIIEKTGCRYSSLLEGTIATNADKKAILAYKAMVAKYGITVDTLGPSAFCDEQSADNWFAFAKRWGMKMITVLPFEKKVIDGKEKMVESEAMLDVLEKMVKKYDIRAAIHNHGPELPYLYPTAESVWKRIAKRDRRIGFCFDIGHQARFGGGDPVQFIRAHGDRIYDVHLKNIKVDPVLNLAEPGPRGELDIYGVLKALADIGFDGVCHIEYEKDHGNNLVPLSESVGYYRGILEALKRANECR